MFHIVDDMDFIWKKITAILKEHGYEAISFGCPKDYISFVNSPDFRNPIAVFTDVTLPGITGYEMINIASELKPDLKFVITAGGPKVRSEYIDRACMYLARPFTPDHLMEVVDSLIQCHDSFPSESHGCSSVDNRRILPIENWSCPLRSKNCSSDCI